MEKAFSVLVPEVIEDLWGRKEFSEIVEAVEAISFDHSLSINEQARLFEEVIRELAKMEE
ncbi:MAG TPA: hypothetical protein VJ962_12360 [Clostridia bacterium]|nr:hypothetical protein [Clostridia bacterium]